MQIAVVLRPSFDSSSRTLLPIAIAVVAAACGADSSAPSSCTDPAVVVSPSAPVLEVGGSTQLSAAFTSGATICDPGITVDQLRWSSSNPAIASVDSVVGLITGLTAGSAYIRARSPNNPAIVDSVRVTVFAPLFDRIVFSVAPLPCPPTEACVPQLRSALPDGSDERVIATTPQFPSHARVAPDGRRVVFEDVNDLKSQLFLADVADGSVRPFDTGTVTAQQPSWSPDGQWILFSGPFGIYVIRPDGTGRRLVSSSGDVNPELAAWSPSGNQVVYMASGQAIIVDLAGTSRQVATAGIAGFNGRFPEWSPDGTTLLFLAWQSEWTITSLDLGSGAYQTLARDVGNYAGSWSPDRQHIVFGVGDLEVMDRDGGNRHVIVRDGRTTFDVSWAPVAPHP
jgi:Periplasmic component of the Tol biopolymer transport system